MISLNLSIGRRILSAVILSSLSLMEASCDSIKDRSFLEHPLGISFSPTQGKSVGGDEIIILGEGLDRVMRVDFGEKAGEILSVRGDSLVVLSPESTVGPVPLVLRDVSGYSFDFSQSFYYLPSTIRFESNVFMEAPSKLVVAGNFDSDNDDELAALIHGEEFDVSLQIGDKQTDRKDALFRFREVFHTDSFGAFVEDSRLHAVDLNLDSLDDLVLYHWGWYSEIYSIHVLINQGDGTFATQNFGDDKLDEGGFHTADFDGDGHMDLAWLGPQLMVLWGSPDGIFKEKSKLELWDPIESSHPYLFGIFFATGMSFDDTSSRPILQSVNLFYQEWLRIGFGSDRKVFVERADYRREHTQLLALIDVNADGLPDLVGYDEIGGISVELGQGQAGFAPPMKTSADCGSLGLPSAMEDPVRLSPGDANGDGATDLFVHSLNQDGCLLFGDGTGNFDASRILSRSHMWIPGDAVWLELDLDGNQDLLRVESNAMGDILRYRFFFGPTMTRVPGLDFDTSRTAETLTSCPWLEDIDSDGQVDLLGILDNQSVFEAVFSPQGKFVSHTLYRFDYATGNLRIGGPADFNQDGLQDVLVLERNSGQESAQILYQQENGNWSAPDKILEGEWAYLSHGQLLGTKQVVLVGYRVSNPKIGEFLQFDKETAGWKRGPVFSWDLEEPGRCATIEDINQDRLADLMIACTNFLCENGRCPGKVTVRLGQIDKDIFTFSEDGADYPVDYWLWDRPFFTDADDDGDLDIIGTGENARFQLRINDGSGNFQQEIQFPVGESFEFQGTADVDGDGLREFLLAFNGLNLEFLRWRSAHQLEGPYSIQNLMPHDPPWNEPPMRAINYPDSPGIIRHHDFTGDGLDDLLMLTSSGWAYSAGHLLLLRNISW